MRIAGADAGVVVDDYVAGLLQVDNMQMGYVMDMLDGTLAEAAWVLREELSNGLGMVFDMHSKHNDLNCLHCFVLLLNLVHIECHLQAASRNIESETKQKQEK